MKRYLSSKLDLTIFYLDCSEEVRFKRMIMRHDGASNAQKRIEIDRQNFLMIKLNYMQIILWMFLKKALMKLQKKFIVYVKSKYFCIY